MSLLALTHHCRILIMKNKIIFPFLIAIVAITLIMIMLYRLADREKLHINDNVRKQMGHSYIRLSNGIVHYELTGQDSARTVVLIHGGTIPMFNYNYQIPALLKAGFRVLRYDQYGRGYSDRPDVLYNRSLYITQLRELLDSLHIKEPIDLLGHSFGGSGAVSFASLYPERVGKVILFSPMINGIKDMSAFKIVRFPIIGNFIAHFIILPLSIKRVDNYFGGNSDTLNKYRELFREQMNYYGFERSLFSMMESDAMRDYTEEFKAVGRQDRDILLIWGDNDNTVSKEMIDSVRRYIPSLEYYEIIEGTHALNFKNPDVFNSIIINFLKSKKTE
jgi:pimeloyl-ACP methyl ester carboxylesterase